MTDTPKTLNPGSKEALDAGCRCPVFDNNHGAGYRPAMDDKPALFVLSRLCPIHGRRSTSSVEG